MRLLKSASGQRRGLQKGNRGPRRDDEQVDEPPGEAPPPKPAPNEEGRPPTPSTRCDSKQIRQPYALVRLPAGRSIHAMPPQGGQQGTHHMTGRLS